MQPVDSAIERRVTTYRILSTETLPQPFEGHYLHHHTTFSTDTTSILLQAGDVIIPMGQPTDRFVMEVLEPDAPDSYFNWNFFDAILQQKEWYSPYVFEDKAAELLRRDPELMADFEWFREHEGKDDPKAQLHWVYTHSPHYEPTHMQLPVFRIER